MDGITVMKVEENNYEDSCSVDPSVSPAQPLEIVTTIDSLVVKSRRKQSLQRRNIEEFESSTPKYTLETHSSSIQDQFNSSSTFRAHSYGNSILVSSALKCEICSATFITSPALNVHLVQFHNYSSEKLNVKELESRTQEEDTLQTQSSLVQAKDAKPYQCTLCTSVGKKSKCYAKESSLRNHIATNHGSTPQFKCEVCFKQFRILKSLQQHSRRHLNLASSAFKCEICSATFGNRTALNHHLVRVHKYSSEKLNVEEFPCDMCSKIYYHRSRLERHVVEAHVVDKPHECHVCSKTFIDEAALSKHLKIHDSHSTHVCDVCSKAFKYRQHLRFHLRVKHHRFFRCNECTKSFSNKSEFDAHSHQLQPQIQNACQICNKTFPNQCSLSVHTEFHNSTEEQNQDSDFKVEKIKNEYDEFKCELCLKTFDREAYIVAHRKLIHRNSRWPCSKCSAAFKTHYRMKQHELTHTRVKLHQCKLCDKSYCKLIYLRAHENNSHLNKQDFKCKLCPKSFATLLGLRVHGTVIHRERVHSKSQKPNKNSLRSHVDTIHCSAPRFKCKVCFKQFNSVSSFKIHSRVHFIQTLPFKCELCSKNFGKRTHLNEHLVRVHKYSSEELNVKEFPCDVCSKIYYQRSHLELHVVDTHVVDKPHECHVCSKTFIDQGALSKHLESHDRQSIHVCDVCSKAFKQTSGLRFHLRVKHHKFFPCHKCKKSFSSKSEFDAHSDLELQIQYACQICSNAFPSQCSLSVHIRFHESTELQNQDSEKGKTSNKNYVEFKCQLCSKTFDRRAYIVAHRRLAHPNSRWPCSKCSRTFKTHYKMTQHDLITHQEVKPHPCNFCPKSFVRQIDLRGHEMRAHFKCHLCPKSFAGTSCLKVHVANDHSGHEFAFICHLCSFETQENKEVAAHYNSHGLPKVTLQRISNFNK